MDNLFNWLIANRDLITLVLFFSAVILVWRVPGIMSEQWRRAAMNLLRCRWQVWRNPNDANAHYRLGDQLYLFERYAEAESVLREASRIDPRHIDALNLLGVILSKDEKRKGEEDALYKQVTEIDPNNKYALDNLAKSAFNSKRYVEATELARKAIAANPEYASAYFTLESALHGMGYDEEAEAVMKRYIQLDSSNPVAYSILAYNNYQRHNYPDAEQYYRRAVELDPTNQKCLSPLVLVLRYQQKNQDALFFLKRLIDLAPKDLGVIFALAAIHKKLGNKSEFAGWAIKAESMIPAEDWYDLACFESICDRPDMAFEHLAHAAKQKDFNSSDAWYDPDFEDIRNDPRFEQIVGVRPE